jgi:hypothetical protein
LVNTKPSLSGNEVRFIRKFLELTQARLADLLGLEEQSVRRWEALEELPRRADRSVRLVFRDVLHDPDPALDELVQRIADAHPPAQYKCRHGTKGWQSEGMADWPASSRVIMDLSPGVYTGTVCLIRRRAGPPAPPTSSLCSKRAIG